MTRLPATEAREKLSEIINRVAFGHERIVLQRRGKDICALVSMEEAALLERLVEEAEDRRDLEEAARRLSDPNEKPIPYERARKSLGLA
jgi:prevent-host-death family protein